MKSKDHLASRRPVREWIKWGIIVYCAIGIALYYLQEDILFHPLSIQKNGKYNFGFPHRDVTIFLDKENTMNIVEFSTDSPVARGVVLYFHGNQKNIGWYAKYAPIFTQHGYELWMMDYPGFGKSSGTFTEDRVYACALQLYRLARTHYSPGQIILYGKSLGTGIASQLAAIRDCKRLILETPYYSLESLVRNFLPIYPIGHMLHYHFSTYEWLPRVTAPITFFHGTDDRLIPYNQARLLDPYIKAQDEFITIQGGGHNDLSQFPLYRMKMDSVLDF
jgi:uncharacterized protein